MNFDKYVNTLPYPDRNDYTTTFYYKAGKCVGQRIGAGAVTFPDGRSMMAVQVVPKDWVTEKVVDEAAFREGQERYIAEARRLEELFKADLFEEFGVSDNPKRELCYVIAYRSGHSHGYSEIYAEFSDIVELIQ